DSRRFAAGVPMRFMGLKSIMPSRLRLMALASGIAAISVLGCAGPRTSETAPEAAAPDRPQPVIRTPLPVESTSPAPDKLDRDDSEPSQWRKKVRRRYA